MKDDKPLPYERREREGKDHAQRVDYFYLRSLSRLARLRGRLLGWAALAAAVGAVPFVAAPFLSRADVPGARAAERVFSNGPMSRAHQMIERDCAQCHTAAFSSVQDAACEKCHDGPSHPNVPVNAKGERRFAVGKLNWEPRCAECHVEHRGKITLADMDSSHCTACHSNLAKNATELPRTAELRITSFREGKHPEFTARSRPDQRPLQLNHKTHMAYQAGEYPLLKDQLPMACGDCHEANPASEDGDMLAVSFERHCRSCHAQELGIGRLATRPGAQPAYVPHVKDTLAIRAEIEKQYAAALSANPALWQDELFSRGGLEGAASAGQWTGMAVKEAEAFLYDKQGKGCTKCHQFERRDERGLPVVAMVNPIEGRFLAGRPGDPAEPWFLKGEFGHRAHRAATCESCHTESVRSVKTSDVLIPAMGSCTECHGGTGTSLDNCSQCHLYHDKSREIDTQRRPARQVISNLAGQPPAAPR